MRRVTVVVAVLVLSGTLVFPSVAAPLFGAADQVSEKVALEPTDSPNGDYAALEDGELVVDLTAPNPRSLGRGINDNAIATFDDVFYINYSGSQYARVWLTHESDAVTFYARNRSIQSRENAVRLGPSGSVAVGFRVNTSGASPGDDIIDNITIHARVAEAPVAAFGGGGGGPVSVVVESTRLDAGRTFTVENARAGERVALESVSLVLAEFGWLTLEELRVATADGGAFTVTASRVADARIPLVGVEAFGAASVTVSEPSASGVLRFSVGAAALERANVTPAELVVYNVEGAEPQRVDVSVVAERDGRVVFEAATSGFSTFVVGARQPVFEVSNASLSASSVAVNESVSVRAVVENRGMANGTHTVVVTVGGERAATRTVTLAPGEQTRINATVTAAAPGTYPVRVDTQSAGTLSVDARTTQTTTSEPTRTTERATSTSTPTTAATSTTTAVATTDTTTPQPEPAGFGLEQVAGLVVLVLVVIGALLLARRRPRRN